MSRSTRPPTELSEMVLYWWKILASPSINLDKLHHFIAFELFLYPLPKTKKIVRQAIRLGYLIEDEDVEEVSLSHDLRQKYQDWQGRGTEKFREMREILSRRRSPKLEITTNMQYEALKSDLVDIPVEKKASKLLGSSIKIDQLDFSEGIIGNASDYIVFSDSNEEEQEVQYPFSLSRRTQIIMHNCPEYLSLRQPQKKFCVHLARLLMKLYRKDAKSTMELVTDIVTNRLQWKFT
ncbi:MAG: hypothetical protein ACTSWW_09160 [Promethearchaeota archaeon]